MFEIIFSFSNSNDRNVVNADEIALRYNFFLGSLYLKKADQSILIDWNWVPLIDFAICLHAICGNLIGKTHGEEEFEFTESDSKIIFKKNGDNLKIVTSFSNEILEMSFEEFQNAVKEFYKNIIFKAIERNQEVSGNDAFIKYLREAEKM